MPWDFACLIKNIVPFLSIYLVFLFLFFPLWKMISLEKLPNHGTIHHQLSWPEYLKTFKCTLCLEDLINKNRWRWRGLGAFLHHKPKHQFSSVFEYFLWHRTLCWEKEEIGVDHCLIIRILVQFSRITCDIIWYQICIMYTYIDTRTHVCGYIHNVT